MIKVNGRAREFNFRKKQIAGNGIYDIDVSDERGDRHYISVINKDGEWSVKDAAAPGWLQEVYPAIIKEIIAA